MVDQMRTQYETEQARNKRDKSVSVCVFFCIIITTAKIESLSLTLKVLVATIDAQWEGMGDVGSARYEPALLPPCLTIRGLSYSS